MFLWFLASGFMHLSVPRMTADSTTESQQLLNVSLQSWPTVYMFESRCSISQVAGSFSAHNRRGVTHSVVDRPVPIPLCTNNVRYSPNIW